MLRRLQSHPILGLTGRAARPAPRGPQPPELPPLTQAGHPQASPAIPLAASNETLTSEQR